MIFMETNRLILRDYEEKDEEAYIRLKSDPETMYYLQGIRLFNKREAESDFQKILQDMKKPDRKYYFFHMEMKMSRRQIGSIGYTVTHNTPVGKLVGAGYFIFPDYWNNGYTSEAFKRILEFAFNENNVYRVSAGCLAENKGSEKVMQKCGLIREAELIDYEWHDGKMKTRLEYRLLKREWDSLVCD